MGVKIYSSIIVPNNPYGLKIEEGYSEGEGLHFFRVFDNRRENGRHPIAEATVTQFWKEVGLNEYKVTKEEYEQACIKFALDAQKYADEHNFFEDYYLEKYDGPHYYVLETDIYKNKEGKRKIEICVRDHKAKFLFEDYCVKDGTTYDIERHYKYDEKRREYYREHEFKEEKNDYCLIKQIRKPLKDLIVNECWEYREDKCTIIED